MMVFLDTSVLLAAAGSSTGASRFLIKQASSHGWELIISGYCVQETLRNLNKIGASSMDAWNREIFACLHLVQDALSLDQAMGFTKTKGRPVVISALAARANVLLTLDHTDFHGALGPQIYGMALRTPSAFLIEPRRGGTF